MCELPAALAVVLVEESCFESQGEWEMIATVSSSYYSSWHALHVLREVGGATSTSTSTCSSVLTAKGIAFCDSLRFEKMASSGSNGAVHHVEEVAATAAPAKLVSQGSRTQPARGTASKYDFVKVR